MLALVSLRNLVRFGLLLAAPFAVVACGDAAANKAPIIDSVDAPLVVSAQNGSYRIPVTVLFHDNDGEAITHLHYRLPPDIDGTVEVPEPNPTRQSAVVTIVIPIAALDTPVTISAQGGGHTSDGRAGSDDDERVHDGSSHQPRSLVLTIVDGRGAESLASASTVTLN